MLRASSGPPPPSGAIAGDTARAAPRDHAAERRPIGAGPHETTLGDPPSRAHGLITETLAAPRAPRVVPSTPCAGLCHEHAPSAPRGCHGIPSNPGRDRAPTSAPTGLPGFGYALSFTPGQRFQDVYAPGEQFGPARRRLAYDRFPDAGSPG